MLKGYKISVPFFEYGPKAYMYGKRLLKWAKFADKLVEKYGIDIVLDPQTVDIKMIADNTKNLHLYAQHMDGIEIGRGMGENLAEALKEAGAKGVMLNHAERKLTLEQIKLAIKRADEVGLATMVCADGLDEIKAVAEMAPNIIVAEPTELIGTGKGADLGYVRESVKIIKVINPEIIVLPSAGIKVGKDCFDVITAGGEASGSSSAIAKAENPEALTEEMVKAVADAWKNRK